jgi:DNA primase small subunit
MTESAQSATSADGQAQKLGKPPQPTEFPPPVARTIDWLQEQYAAWYRRNPPPMPDRFTRREFGYILWPERPGPPPFLRHRAYEDASRFHWYLQKAGPHSVYYSTAYYRRPGELKMVDKQWLGAELIFDLDADHLVEAERAKADGHEMPLAQQLALVKTQFKRLLDEFLFGDFGLSEQDVWITFSGGRGYHAHVVESRLMQLDSKARREVVDYITGKFPAIRGSEQPDISFLLKTEAIPTQKFGREYKFETRVTAPPIDSPGWGGRLTRKVAELLEINVVGKPKEEAIRWLTTLEGIGKTRAERFVEQYQGDNRRRLLGGYENQSWSLHAGGEVRNSGILAGQSHVLTKVYEIAAAQFAMPMAKGETDEPVTADVKRLIRLPGSLHGKSGLKVVTLTRSTLDAFDPLKDAVAFPLDPVTIVPRNDQEMTLGGERVAVKKGEPVPVPMAHAVFWLARQGGTIFRPA